MSFIYGLLISFSPCILMMLPIVLKMCGTVRGTISYLSGSMISYLVLGVLLSSVGIYFQNVLHTWPVISLFSLVLGYLSLSCFNIVRLPQYYIHSSNTFFIGLLTPIIVSPCMTPALGGIITLMATNGYSFYSFLDIVLFGLGANIPIILGSFGLTKVLKNKKLLKYSEWIVKINGILLVALILHLWEFI